MSRLVFIPERKSTIHYPYISLTLTFFLLLFNTIKPQGGNTVTSSFNLKNSNNNSLFYVQDDGRIGIGLTAPEASLHIIGKDGLVFTGAFNTGAVLNPGGGVRMMWYPRKGAFRAGSVDGSQWDDKLTGIYSLATGYMTQANGDYSVALGINNIASGQASIAMGRNSVSSSFFSTAIGFYASALGESSFSLGYHTLANGKYSFAFGYKASTNGYDGAFCLSDASSQSGAASSLANQATMKFAGGYRFFSNSSESFGVLLNPGSNSWASIADSGKRENFLALNSEDILNKISSLKLGTWNLKGQDIRKERHYGISAQEFNHLFGKDSLGFIGNDTTITNGDFEGVALLALHGLEKRTTSIRVSMAQLDSIAAFLKEKDSLIISMKNNIEQLQEKIKEKDIESQKLNERLDMLEAAFNSLEEVKARKPE